MSRACRGRHWGSAIFFLLLAGWLPRTLPAAQYFLTVGGGYAPSGNQVSLERNVLYFQRLLAEQGLGAAPHEIFFADGNDPARDLQYIDPGLVIPPVNVLLARLAGEDEGLELQYRNHELPGQHAAATRAHVVRWFDEVGRKLTARDRLFVYLTGHGGKGDSGENTLFHLWNGERMTMKEFTAQLDRVRPEVSVVLVMVQCYSGGFANVIFQGGDPDQGVSPARRCGFFATVHDRVASGCTPDAQEENYQEYSTCFWAALGGRNRLGESMASPDYDGDGHTSFAEAHAYALVRSPTIDISVKTSDAYLRAFSKTKSRDHDDLLTSNSPCDDLLAVASSAERAVIEQLSTELQLVDSRRAAAAEELASQVNAERRRVDGRKRKLAGEYQKVRAGIRGFVKQRWPELDNPYHPVVCSLMHNDGSALIAAVEKHPDASRFRELHEQSERLGDESLDLQRRWAKCQRLIRTLENVALAANLPKLATDEQVARYQELLACEASWLLDPAVNGIAAPLDEPTVSSTAPPEREATVTFASQRSSDEADVPAEPCTP